MEGSSNIIISSLSPTSVSSSSSLTQSEPLLTTTLDTILNTTTESKHRGILNQLFLQTIGCQIISGFFAWAALCITIHHVNKIYCFFFFAKLNISLKIH
jgi:hypothetical protein